jgi:hypothetical protein
MNIVILHWLYSLKLKAYLIACVYKAESSAVEIRYADHVAPSIHKSWH